MKNYIKTDLLKELGYESICFKHQTIEIDKKNLISASEEFFSNDLKEFYRLESQPKWLQKLYLIKYKIL